MNEAIRNLVLLIWTVSAINTNANAQSVATYSIEEEAPASAPVLVFGSANLGKNRRDEVLVEQNGEANPLGNPIDDGGNGETAQSSDSSSQPAAKPSAVPISETSGGVVTETLPQNPQLSPQESPQNVNGQIQDTLYESGGRIYDVQSYPAEDIKKIEEPNLNPTITTYPAD